MGLYSSSENIVSARMARGSCTSIWAEAGLVAPLAPVVLLTSFLALNSLATASTCTATTDVGK